MVRVAPVMPIEDSVHHPSSVGQGSSKSLLSSLFCETREISGLLDAILSQRIANLALQILHLPGVFTHEATRLAR
jgi:hypothetical protein